MKRFHEPVLGECALEFLNPTGSGLYLDGTVGGGGHTRKILERCPECCVLAVDRDAEAISEAKLALAEFDSRVEFLHQRFDHVPQEAQVLKAGLDGALLDLGVSSHQIDRDDRGFAFRKGVALDMRMDRSEEQNASHFLAEKGEEELAQAFRDFGEERKAKRLAREIVKRRSSGPLQTSDDLVAALSVSLGRSPSARDKARIFQAVRIAVNEELEALKLALPAIREVMNEKAVMVVISYHSLEDRLVKNAFRDWSSDCLCPPELPLCTCRGRSLGKVLTKRPIMPSDREVVINPRARSARLRAWRRAA